ncbi:MAG TPA: TonB family protein [Opitutaceae bacterium]|nr:TonB family protein [Opitutaceae bacterium]
MNPYRLPIVAALSALAAVVPVLRAQDVTVTSLVWKYPYGAPDELPTLKTPMHPPVPAQIQGSPDINYVIYTLYLDADGKILGIPPLPTLPFLGSEFANLRPHQARNPYRPGRRAGKAVNTETSFSFIYNPGSAATERPDATPRLLVVTPVTRMLPRGTKREAMPDSFVVYAKVEIDENGKVARVLEAPAKLERELSQTAQEWRFAPARQAGRAVPATITMPFIVTYELPAVDPSKRLKIPRVVSQRRPEYPFEMRANGLGAEVRIDFVVDIEGRVRNAYAVRSSNPSFDDAALDAVRQWRFEPGEEDGHPVRVHMQVPVIFQLQGGDQTSIVTTQRPDLSKLPEEYRYDTAPVPVGIARPVYPYALLRAHKEGRAVVRYVVGPSGEVVYAKVHEASDPEFGAALLAAVELFVYTPASKAGRPSSALVAFESKFTLDEYSLLATEEDLDLIRLEQKDPASIVGMRSLDAPLQPLARQPAKFPLSVPNEVSKGTALIEFLVDQEGRVRLPRLVEASLPPFGYAALQSVAHWRFEPPLSRGHPAVVRVRLPFEFSRRPAPPSSLP